MLLQPLLGHISNISKGTWESNPYVWVYDFELIR
nr:MAG TPA: ASCH domain protein [Caudoviricetes sp.]